MKDYYKYLTVGEIKEQIKDTLVSAKQKLEKLSESRKRNNPIEVNQRFNNYIKELKYKQKTYDTEISQTNEIDILLNRRKNKINQSLEKYQKNIKSKTNHSFYHCHTQASSFQDENKSNMNAQSSSFLTKNAQSKIYQEKSRLKYETEPNSKVDLNEKLNQLKKVRTKTPEYCLTECQPSEESQNRNLRSITKVVNIQIESNQGNKNLFSFAKDSIKAEVKRNIENYQEKNMKNVQKQLRMETAPSQPMKKVAQKELQKYQKQKQKIKESSQQHKAFKKIKARIKQNQLNTMIQWKSSKKVQNIKSLQLKFQYQTFIRNDLRIKVGATCDVHQKIRKGKKNH